MRQKAVRFVPVENRWNNKIQQQSFHCLKEEMSAKRKLCKEYSDGLISNGGISTDVFKEQLGEDTTRDFFDKVLFGTEHYGN